MLVIYLLPLSSKFTLFTPCSEMLGLGFWKLYFPDFFASSPSAHPARWQQQRRRQGGRKGEVASSLCTAGPVSAAQDRGCVPPAAAASGLSPSICQHFQNLPLGPLIIASSSWAVPHPPRSEPLLREALP